LLSNRLFWSGLVDFFLIPLVGPCVLASFIFLFSGIPSGLLRLFAHHLFLSPLTPLFPVADLNMSKIFLVMPFRHLSSFFFPPFFFCVVFLSSDLSSAIHLAVCSLMPWLPRMERPHHSLLLTLPLLPSTNTVLAIPSPFCSHRCKHILCLSPLFPHGPVLIGPR